MRKWKPAPGVWTSMEVIAGNVYCPTGEGGGVDPTCSPGGSGSSRLNLGSKMNYVGSISKPKARAVETAFNEALSKVEANFGEAAVDALEKNLTGKINLYGGPVAIVNDLRKYGVRGRAAGYYNRQTKEVGVIADEYKPLKRGSTLKKNVEGEVKVKKEPKFHISEGVLAHELSHAIDGPAHKYSNSSEFDSIFKAESSRPSIREEAKSSKSELFADLYREFLSPRDTEYSLETYKHEPIPSPDQRHPEMHAFLKKERLIK